MEGTGNMDRIADDNLERDAASAGTSGFSCTLLFSELQDAKSYHESLRSWIIDSVRDISANMDDDGILALARELYWNQSEYNVTEICQMLNDSVEPNRLYMFVGKGAEMWVDCWKCGSPMLYQPTSRSDKFTRKNYHHECDSCVNGHGQDRAESDSRHHEYVAKRKAYLHDLKTMPYGDYLQTDHWQAVRSAALKRARFACQLCNARTVLHVHHRTYERRGEEFASDVIALCAECHKTFHGKA